MNRQNIILSDFEYICDLYDYSECSEAVLKKYVIIRNLDFINGIACDKDIYFIEKDIYEDIVNSNSTITSKLAYPIDSSNFGSFSKSYTDFSQILNIDTFKLETEGGNVFSLYTYSNGKYTEANIKCDMVRIYHPHNKTDLEYIIYFDNVINGIHFHYFCNYNTNQTINATTEMRINKNQYSEYIEFYIPNINRLFKEYDIVKDSDGNIIEDDNIYFNDFYNITKYVDGYQYEVMKKEKTWYSMKSSKTMFDDVEKLGYMPLHLLLNPYIISTNSSKQSEKVYFKLTYQECNNYNSFPINITLYPFEESDSNNILLINQTYTPNSDTYVKDNYFELISKIGFNNNQLCVSSYFEYVNKNLNVQEAYAKYNGLPLNYDETTDKYTCPLYEGWIDDEYSDYTYDELINILDKRGITGDERENILDIKNKKDELSESDDFGENCLIKCCGYQIDIATDFTFTNIIGSEYRELDFIDNFEFSLVHLFDNWYNIPSTIIIRIKYIDKYLGIIMHTGFIILNKEWIKYTINHSNTTRLYKEFTNKQNDLSDNMSWNTINASDDKVTFNFIDKINCIVDKTDTSVQNISSKNQNLKIIYKPVFYKTQALQSISLKTGLNQKIGINLSQYMTKVSLFKLIIDDNEITEYGRNDIYVIFEINAGDLTNTSGTYNIVDSNDNYISSGDFTVA